MSALSRLTATETRLFFREPMVVFFALGFAPLLFVILGLIPALREPDEDFGGAPAIVLYSPIVVVLGAALFSLSGLAPLFAAYREKGILRRLRTTPVRPATMLAAQLIMATVLALVSVVVIVAVGRLAFDVPLPRNPLGFLLAFLLLAAAIFAIGLLVAALAPTSTSASASGTLLFFPLAFLAGLWLPRPNMPEVLRAVSDLSPLGAGVQSLQDAAAGEWPQLLHLAVMTGWTLAAGGLAARYFRWE